MYCGPEGKTFITFERFRESLPQAGEFEAQLEGGEPTAHPLFQNFVRILREEERCTKIIVSTNGTLLPRTEKGVSGWLDSLGRSFTIKLSINHYLLGKDPGLLGLAQLLARQIESRDGGSLVLNVRLRKGAAGDDKNVVEKVEKAGLSHLSNIFFLQRYGRASNEESWETPFLVGYNFTMINPDGASFGQDMQARSQAMGGLA